MTTLPACLPVAVAACMVAAGVCAVLLPVCGWIDWRERRHGAREATERGLGAPKSPQRQSGRGGALTEPRSPSCDRTTDPKALSAPESPSGGASPPEPHPTAPKPAEARTARQETP